MRYRYRCTHRVDGKICGTRVTKPKLLEFYVRRPRCPSCGCDSLRLDTYRMKHEVGRRAGVCHCDGYPFPHRHGSLECRHYAGPRDLAWEQLNNDLGVTPLIDTGDVPF